MSKDDKKQKQIRQKIKDDKIFNNGYKTGEGMGDDDYEYSSSISVDINYSDRYLKDVYEYEEYLDYNIGLDKIFKIIENDHKLSSLLHKLDDNNKIKLQKEEVNWCFNQILKILEAKTEGENFYNPIYILEALSSILNINSSDPIKDYRKIFDCLDVEIQEELIIELNKKFKFLEGKMNKRRMH